MTLETRTVSGFVQPVVLGGSGPKVEIENILCHLHLSDSDVEQIARLVERGVQVTRNAMQGDDYLSVSWSFSPLSDENDENEPTS